MFVRSFFLLFDTPPLLPQCLFIGDGYAAEDMGMAPNHLGHNSLQYLLDGKLTLFGKHGCQHGQNKMHIAHLLANGPLIATVNGFSQFPAFFQKIFF
jgi:hypothetical protein